MVFLNVWDPEIKSVIASAAIGHPLKVKIQMKWRFRTTAWWLERSVTCSWKSSWASSPRGSQSWGTWGCLSRGQWASSGPVAHTGERFWTQQSKAAAPGSGQQVSAFWWSRSRLSIFISNAFITVVYSKSRSITSTGWDWVREFRGVASIRCEAQRVYCSTAINDTYFLLVFAGFPMNSGQFSQMWGVENLFNNICK